MGAGPHRPTWEGGATLFVVGVTVIIAAIVVAWARRGHTRRRKQGSRAVATAGLIASVSASVALFPGTQAEEGRIFALVVLGFPVVIAAGAAAAAGADGTSATAAGWGASLVLCAYVLVFGLGLGLFFAPSALLLVTSMLLGGEAAARGLSRP